MWSAPPHIQGGLVVAPTNVCILCQGTAHTKLATAKKRVISLSHHFSRERTRV